MAASQSTETMISDGRDFEMHHLQQKEIKELRRTERVLISAVYAVFKLRTQAARHTERGVGKCKDTRAEMEIGDDLLLKRTGLRVLLSS